MPYGGVEEFVDVVGVETWGSDKVVFHAILLSEKL